MPPFDDGTRVSTRAESTRSPQLFESRGTAFAGQGCAWPALQSPAQQRHRLKARHMNRNEIKAVVKAAGGSTLTRESRSANLTATANDLRLGLNIQIKSFSGLRTQHLQSLVTKWKTDGQSTRTIQNKLAHLRAALRGVGREKFAADSRNSNAALGASGGSRSGTHTTPDEKTLEGRISALPEPFQAGARLQQTLGLRAQEAVQSNQSLRVWENQILAGRPVTVLHGTKGGRPRSISLLDQASKEQALAAVQAAISVIEKQDGKLIPSSTLEGANRAYQRGRIQIRSATPVDSMNEGGMLRAVDQQLSVHSKR